MQPIPVWKSIGQTPAPLAGDEDVPVVIIGGGPVGLTAALDLGQRGHRVIVLNRLNFIAAGSKAICFAKRTLDIWNRLGVAGAMIEKGVIWNIGKVFRGNRADPIYSFDMLALKDQAMPGFINLQQYHAETILVDALAGLPNVELRWGHEATAIVQSNDKVRLTVTAGDRRYTVSTAWVLACDGSKSPTRDMLGLDFDGRVFEDNFLIADIRMTGERPSERWFWFDPPFNPGKSALLHKQPDDIWRLDFQLGWDIDRDACIRPENVAPLIRGMLGDDIEFTPEWYSLYTFQCRRMQRFVHDRVIFAGDSAHLVSPFGARGCNGGVADVDNLCWKLDLVLRGKADERLVESYNDEAVVTADENILNSTRSTDFMTPKSSAGRAFRDAVLDLAETHAFAQPFVNSGRLSTAVHYPRSPLSTEDQPGESWHGIAPGSPAIDAPLAAGWLLDRLGGDFTLLVNGVEGVEACGINIVDVAALKGVDAIVQRYDLTAGSASLVRPDQYIAARWRAPTAGKITAALSTATGRHA